MTAPGDAVARVWTRTYTAGLPADAAARRREEIASDLFDHASLTGRSPAQQAHVLGRVLWGIPADLSWRRAARAPRERRLETGAAMTLNKLAMAVFGFVVLFDIWAGFGVVFGGDAGLVYPVALWAGAAVVATGIAKRSTWPRASSMMIVGGASITPFVLYWMAPILVPAWLVVLTLAVATEPKAPGPVLSA